MQAAHTAGCTFQRFNNCTRHWDARTRQRSKMIKLKDGRAVVPCHVSPADHRNDLQADPRQATPSRELAAARRKKRKRKRREKKKKRKRKRKRGGKEEEKEKKRKRTETPKRSEIIKVELA